ncbi:D-glycerate dehydrogenase [Candidatus Uhrbacteria bacterium]|nr:D-glycerate dehydrogenase [Candidatus Uhrbacteria bacterium]
MGKHVLITRPIPDAGIALLKKKGLLVDVSERDTLMPRKELIRRLRAKKYDALLSILTDHIDESVLKAGGASLRVVANYAVGVDNIDLEAAKRHGVIVCNAAGDEISESVAEHAIALMFALAHRIVEADEYARRGHYVGWGPQLLLGTDLIGKTVGIVGVGAIGERVMRRLWDGFHIKLLYANPRPNIVAEQKYGAKRMSLRALLRQADFVSLHLPLLPSTHHLIGRKEFDVMKKTAYLVNTARGAIVDEAALIDALRKKKIAGAALDVFEHEPRIPKALLAFSNVITTPHTASATIETRQAMSRRAAENIVAALSGRKPKNRVV